MAIIDNIHTYYKYDSSNATQPDEVASNDGTVTAATYDASGKLNGCYDFNGTSAKILSNNVGTGNTVMSVNYWVKPDNVSGYQSHFFMGGRSANNGFGVTNDGANNDGSLMLSRYGNDYLQSVGVIDNTAFYMITVTHDGTTSKLYINGAFDSSNAETLSISIGDMAVGSLTESAGQWFSGKIDEFGTWSKALSQAEITALYNGGAGLAYPLAEAGSKRVKVEMLGSC